VSDTAGPGRVPAAARRAALATAGLLAACVIAAAWPTAWPSGLALMALLLVPLLLPLPGLIAGRRRTCAWATLCVAPYFVYGLTELIANPVVRIRAAAILFASLAWFVALVACLRVSRPAPAPAQGEDAA
jgi:uncharacterized membrane protein